MTIQFDKNRPLISVIVPCYKCVQTIEECIDSLCNSLKKCEYANSYKFEIIMVDDGSPDNGQTAKTCQKLATKYQQDNLSIIAKSLPENLGLPGARNAGMKFATGKYFAFIDSDDTVKSKFFSVLIDAVECYKKSEIFVWGLSEKYLNEAGMATKTVQFVPREAKLWTKADIMKSVIDLEESTLFGYAWNKLYDADFLYANNLQFENIKLIEDVMFNIAAFNNAQYVNILEVDLHNYLRRSQNENQTSQACDGNNNSSITNEYHSDYFDMFYKKVWTLYDWFEREACLTDRVKTVLANEYSRYSFSAIWRNRNPKSGMNENAQRKWISDFYNLDMTKALLEYIKPQGRLAAIMGRALQSKNINRICRIAAIIEFVTNNFGGLLNRLRQSR